MQISQIIQTLTNVDTLPVLTYDLKALVSQLDPQMKQEDLTKLAADAIVISTKIAYLAHDRSALLTDVNLGLSLDECIRDLETIKEVI